MVELRHKQPEFISPNINNIHADSDVLRFTKGPDHLQLGAGFGAEYTEQLIIMLNFSDHMRIFDEEIKTGKIIFTTKMDRKMGLISGKIKLRPHEGIIIKVS